MNRASKIGILVATHLAAAGIGASAGIWYLERSLWQMNALMSNMMLITRYATHAELQRVEGGDEEYRESLLAFLAALDQARNPDDPLYSEKVNLTDKTLTYVRLARLEQRTGNQASYERYMTQAVSTCKRITWKNCEAGHLVSISERLEKKSLSGEPNEKSKQEGKS